MAKIRDEGTLEGTISLSEAFQRFIEYRFGHLRDLKHKASESLHSVGTHELDAETGEWRRVDLPKTPAVNALEEYESALRQAELSFREWLDSDGPAAFTRDPITREWLRISRRWTHDLPRTLTLAHQGKSSIVSTSPGNLLPGFDEDFVSPNDMLSHGPSDAQFDGILSKVFFEIEEFEEKLQGSPVSPRGRKPKFDWTAAESEAKKLMGHHGPFSPDDPEWDCAARLEDAITNFFAKKLGFEAAPSESTIRSKVSEWLSSPAFKVGSSDTDRPSESDSEGR